MRFLSFKERLVSQLWILGIGVSLLVAFILVAWVIPSPCWWAACGGWILVALNSMLARLIHERAAGVSRNAFVGWGIIANSIRMLTLVIIFAYMTHSFQIERGSFLVAGLSAFFVMMPVEVFQLFRFQNRAVEKFEYGRDAN